MSEVSFDKKNCYGSNKCLSGKNNKRRKIVKFFSIFCLWRQEDTKKTKKLIFDYLLLYLVAIIVTIATHLSWFEY